MATTTTTMTKTMTTTTTTITTIEAEEAVEVVDALEGMEAVEEAVPDEAVEEAVPDEAEDDICYCDCINNPSCQCYPCVCHCILKRRRNYTCECKQLAKLPPNPDFCGFENEECALKGDCSCIWRKLRLRLREAEAKKKM